MHFTGFFMTLRRKTLITLSITLAALVVLLYFVLRILLVGSFNRLEEQVNLRDLNRARNSFQGDSTNLGHSIEDWSIWDDSYKFIQDNNSDYISANLNDSTFKSLDINLMMFINNDKKIVYAKADDLDPASQNHFLQDFEDYTHSDDRFLRLTTDAGTTGFVIVADFPLLIASRPILHSDGSGPS